MRQLRSCDFCGADADGIYEVLPPELSPAEDEQRRVVLCGDCASTLETVLEPLLDRLGVEGGDEGVERGRAGRDERTDSLGSNSPMVAGRDTDDQFSAEASDADSPNDSAATDDARSDADSPSEHAATTDTETAGIADAADEEAGEPLQAAGGDDAGERERTAEPERTGGDAGDEGRDDAAAGEEPPQFRKVMRLLNNREFPVERAEVEELAGGAYDLDDDHVRDIIDYAVERGVLADDGGTLRKP